MAEATGDSAQQRSRTTGSENSIALAEDSTEYNELVDEDDSSDTSSAESSTEKTTAGFDFDYLLKQTKQLLLEESYRLDTRDTRQSYNLTYWVEPSEGIVFYEGNSDEMEGEGYFSVEDKIYHEVTNEGHNSLRYEEEALENNFASAIDAHLEVADEFEYSSVGEGSYEGRSVEVFEGTDSEGYEAEMVLSDDDEVLAYRFETSDGDGEIVISGIGSTIVEEPDWVSDIEESTDGNGNGHGNGGN